LKQILEKLESLAIKIDSSEEGKRNTLIKCAETSLNSKLLAHYKTFFAEIVVQAVSRLDSQGLMDKKLIAIKHVTGGSVKESMLVDGIAFKKTFSYAGFEQQPKSFNNPKILLLNIELELKAEKETAEIRIEKPSDYQGLIDAEWNLIYAKLEEIISSGANIVLSKLPIGDLATQYFADRNIFCAGRVAEDDLDKVARCSGGKIQSTLNGLTPNVLGTCGNFQEVQLGSERFNFFTKCPTTQASTIILRGGADQFIQEAERSLNDAIMIVRRAVKAEFIVPGGGAIEFEISKSLKEFASKIEGKELAVIMGFAKALEIIPKTLAENAGLDPNEIINKLRKAHYTSEEGKYWGVDVNSAIGIQNTYENFIWEPLQVKKNIINSATEVR
jgi:T-complex protein 1 subunit eta